MFLVCEEYFVPALNILCEELNVPDDVAGETVSMIIDGILTKKSGFI